MSFPDGMEDAIVNHRALADVERLKAENASLRWLLAHAGFEVLDGHFVRKDGTRSTVAVRPVDVEVLLKNALQAAHADDD